DGGTRPAATESATEPPAAPPAENAIKPVAPEQVTPSMTSPTPLGRQSMNTTPSVIDATASVEIPQAQAAPSAALAAIGDITGTIPSGSSRKGAIASVPPLPDIIGGPPP